MREKSVFNVYPAQQVCSNSIVKKTCSPEKCPCEQAILYYS